MKLNSAFKAFGVIGSVAIIMIYFQNCGPMDASQLKTLSEISSQTSDTSGSDEADNSTDETPSGSTQAPKGVQFFDSFETASLEHTNIHGFRWGGTNRTSIVSSSAGVYTKGESINTPKPEGRNWNAYAGEHSMRFRYPEGEAWAEQRYEMGTAYPEVWISYWVRVPENYTHGPIGSPRNQKWNAVWTDDYSQHGDGPTEVFNMRPDGSGGGSASTVSIVKATNMNSAHRESYPGFIKVPEDRGRWMHNVFYLKIASSPTADDGQVKWWRRWQGDDSFTTLANMESVGLWPNSGPQGFSAGYIMGWANGAYAEDTEFLIDNFTISTESLLIID